MSDRENARVAEELAWLINVVGSRFPGYVVKGIGFTQYESLGEIHVAFDLKKKEEAR